jgi:tetratricopeptide (TPR) repeat protein
MSTARIEDLKRRIQRDPASIAFAQLGEEYRRAGRFREAIDTCRAGLSRHPGYLSARVTLGRALLALGELEQASRELQEVLRLAPENLAALRCLADIAWRSDNTTLAQSYLQRALALAPNDPELHRLAELVGAASPRRDTPASPPVSVAAPPDFANVPPSSPSVDEEASAEARELAAALQQPSPQDAHTHRAIEALERWHETIVAHRKRPD